MKIQVRLSFILLSWHVAIGLQAQNLSQVNFKDQRLTCLLITLEEVQLTGITCKRGYSSYLFKCFTKRSLPPRNLGQDIPILLNYLPAVVTTSDAGAGIGYTGIRVRGSDATRVNVTLNGIPYNDAESQGTFWVNLTRFCTSSVDQIQLQRGVGTSTNGSAAFGASLNVENIGPTVSKCLLLQPFQASLGSFQLTFKNTCSVFYRSC